MVKKFDNLAREGNKENENYIEHCLEIVDSIPDFINLDRDDDIDE